jgi:ferric-dicitrate binding protein FerR (iron transport regulator)
MNKSVRAPFEVCAGQVRLTAFDGSFNIRAYSDSLISITAIEGTLEVQLLTSSVTLQPREQLIITGSRMELNKQADIAQVLEWERK